MATRCQQHKQGGAALLIFLIIMFMGGMTYLVNNLDSFTQASRRAYVTTDAMKQAQDALLGYALKFRDEQLKDGQRGIVYGYLPLPDLGTSRNNNVGCQQEGCDAADFLPAGTNAPNLTIIGRFPWRVLGLPPLRDSHGECLWYALSGSHQRIQRGTPMNWDTLGQIDILIANGSAALASTLASAHDRPVAIIFSAGPPLPGQIRTNSSTDTVSECGGNYNAANYLDPGSTALDGTENYFTVSSPNRATGDTTTNVKPLATAGTIYRKSDDTLWPNGCPTGSNCTLAANDRGLGITSEMLFGALRKSANFRADINSMLDRMTSCLRDQLVATGSLPSASIAGFAVPANKSAGRIGSNTCYDDAQNPLGYFSHYQDQLFVAKASSGNFTVTTDGTAQSCPGVLIFAGQRSTSQSRATTTDKNTPSNYLDDNNLTSFTTTPTDFTGDSQLLRISSTQVQNRDIVRCIPSTASLTLVAPTVTASAGNIQLASYAPATQTLTLGSAGINSNYGATGTSLYACAWATEAHSGGSGFRSYFRFRIQQVGEGFTFAVIDGDRNGNNVCGSAYQHLGYSGNNGATPYIQPPKMAIEFDTARNANFAEPASLSNGRYDPCYQSSCGAAQNLSSNAHVAAVYWGYESAHAITPVVTQIQEDDNVHGFPWPPDSSVRPAPLSQYPVMPYPSPAPSPPYGLAPVDSMGATSPLTTASAKREYHARIEVTRNFTTPADAKDGNTAVQVKVWVAPHQATNISAMTYASGAPPTVTVTAAGHGFSTGDSATVKDAVPTGYNGTYTVTRIDANRFRFNLPTGTPDPGRYIARITWADVSSGTDRATVNSPSHGLITGNSITIAGAVPTNFNGIYTITRIDNDNYRFGIELNYEPGDMSPAIAAANALTPLATAIANTTRPMSELYPTAAPLIQDSITLYDEQTSACAVSAPRCATGQSCGSDNMCYRPSFRNLRPGFTIGERATTTTATARGQLIEIKNQATTWLP